MLKVSIQVQMNEAGAGSVTRTSSSVNRDYIGYTGSDEIPGVNELPYVGDEQLTSFPEWADKVGRAISSLNKYTYIDTVLTAAWSTGEEIA